MPKYNREIELPSKEIIEAFINTPFSDEELEEINKNPEIQKLIKTIKGLNPEELEMLQNKYAYPNFDDYIPIPGQRNVEKWLATIKEMYYKEKSGINKIEAFKQCTSNWDDLEIYDFTNWLRFYQQGNHMKYKTAQNFYGNLNNGYLLPIKKDDPIEEVKQSVDITEEKKQLLVDQLKKILKRLDSAEKLLRDSDLTKEELSAFLSAIYTLKEKIQTVNKRSKSSKLYNDMIYRQGNILNKKGFSKVAKIFYKLAEEKKTDLSTAPTAAISNPTPAIPTQNQGSPGGLPSMGPGMPQNPPESSPNDSPTFTISEGLKGFLSNLSGDKNDNLEVEDDELCVEDNIVTAQAQPINPVPVKKPIEKVPEVKPISEIKSEIKEFDISDKIDQVLSNVKVHDIIIQLENISKIFKVREIPRQLSIVDMMLDKLGMASFFPALAEAINKSLESNNYISTRIDEVLSKLRGAIVGEDIDLKPEDSIQSNEVQNVKTRLQQNIDKEKARKEFRKEQEMKETPEIEVKEDLKPEEVAKVTPQVAKVPVPAKPITPPVV